MRTRTRNIVFVASVGLGLLLSSYIEGGGCQTQIESKKHGDIITIFNGDIRGNNIAYFECDKDRYMIIQHALNKHTVLFDYGKDKIIDGYSRCTLQKVESTRFRKGLWDVEMDAVQSMHDENVASIDSILAGVK